MKTSKDPRHKKRIEKVKNLFAHSFNDTTKQSKTTKDIFDNLHRIDRQIAIAAPEWPLEKINKIDLAILRQSTYELLFEPKTPEKVVIDEAIEIAKKYGSESSPSFINGVLGTILLERNEKTNTKS